MTCLNDELSVRGYEGFKFAAASTMVGQPNDVGHCHKAIKAYYRGNKYNDSEAWEVPAYLVGFDSTLSNAGIDRGSVKSYWKALCHMETCLSKTCTIPMIKAGYIHNLGDLPCRQ